MLMLAIARVIARFTLLEALRSRLAWVVVLAVAACLGLAEFLSQVALSDALGYRNAIAAALLRLVAVFLTALFVITSLVREMHDKVLDMLLALPINRATFVAGKLLGFAAVAGAVAAVAALALLLRAPLDGTLMWGLSLGLELWLVAAMSLLALVTFSQVPAAMATVLGFYLLSRSIAALQLIGHGPLLVDTGTAQQVAVLGLDGLAFVLPELHRFTRTEWLLESPVAWADLLPLLAQTGIYGALLGLAALFDLYRKNL